VLLYILIYNRLNRNILDRLERSDLDWKSSSTSSFLFSWLA